MTMRSHFLGRYWRMSAMKNSDLFKCMSKKHFRIYWRYFWGRSITWSQRGRSARWVSKFKMATLKTGNGKRLYRRCMTGKTSKCSLRSSLTPLTPETNTQKKTKTSLRQSATHPSSTKEKLLEMKNQEREKFLLNPRTNSYMLSS